MTVTLDATWQEANRLHLAAVLDELLVRLTGEDPPAEAGPAADAVRAAMTEEPALPRLAALFGLDGFAGDVVAWCAGFELDGRYRAAGSPTVGRTLERLPGPSWRAWHPASPLRRYGLVEVGGGSPFVEASLRLAGDVLLYLLGLPPGSRPGRVLVVDDDTVAAPPSQHRLADAITASLSAGAGTGPVVSLHGATRGERRLVARLCARRLGAGLVRLDLRDAPAPGPALDELLTDASRLTRLTGAPLLVECAGAVGGEAGGDGGEVGGEGAGLRRVVALVDGLVLVSSDRPALVDPGRVVMRREVSQPDARERLGLWESAIDGGLPPGREPPAGGEAWLHQVASQFGLDSPSIAAVGAEATAPPGAETTADGAGLEAAVRAGCRRQARVHLDPVAQRVPLDDEVEVVLPAHQTQQLEELGDHIVLGLLVATEWGMGGVRAPGVAALFAGPSGTGKTAAAAAVARRVGLDLYRVDLAAVLSRYIGETEKNLRRIFDAAETGGAILLFDEADALFGKRSEVKDSHDRYANISTAYLLQRMERAVTPTILTTNTRAAIDPAFARRLRFVVEFPFPDERARERIWRGVYPARTPTTGIDAARLATLAVNGATIRKIALRAAFLAARDGDAVSMHHVAEASRRELRQAGRTLRPEEEAAWR